MSTNVTNGNDTEKLRLLQESDGLMTDAAVTNTYTSLSSPPPPPQQQQHNHHTSTSKWEKYIKHIIYSDEIAFATRLAVVLTLSSLFILIRFFGKDHDGIYPMGSWITISALFVVWFPNLDAASVLEKIYQRWLGTILGATIGCICGMISITIPILYQNPRTYQAIFLACCMFLITFIVVSIAGLIRFGSSNVRNQSHLSQPKLIDQYSYAVLLCMSTFCICILPFALDNEPKWKPAMYRVINVTIGCMIGAIGAILICPRTTRHVVYTKTSHQYTLCGEASEAVLLTAAEAFSGRIQPQMLSQGILSKQNNSITKSWRFLKRMDTSFNSTTTTTAAQQQQQQQQHPTTGVLHFDVSADDAIEKYENAISDWKATKALFPLLKYDPFRMFHITTKRDPEKEMIFQTNMATTLARTLRIQSTIVVLDGMIRNDTECNLSSQQLLLIAEIGRLIHITLTLPLNITRSDIAADELFTKLIDIRHGIIEASNQMKLKVVQQQQQQHTKISIFSKTPTIKEEEDVINIQEFRNTVLNSNKNNNNSSRTTTTSLFMEDDDYGRGVPKYATSIDGNTMLFLQLVEHLIVRSLRLYHSWKITTTLE